MLTFASHVNIADSPPATCRVNVPLSGARNDPCQTTSHSRSLYGSIIPLINKFLLRRQLTYDFYYKYLKPTRCWSYRERSSLLSENGYPAKFSGRIERVQYCYIRPVTKLRLNIADLV